jgi:iron complex transport system substrate-binding protein
MENKKLKILILSSFILMGLSRLGMAESLTINDLSGRPITLPQKVQRVIAIGPGALRLVVYLNAFDKIVGIEEAEKGKWTLAARPYSIAIAEKAKEIPSVAEGGPGKLPDFEKIMMLKPDVLFVIGMERSQVENLQEKTRIPTVILNYGDIGVFREEAIISLKLLGKILNREERAEKIINYINRCKADLENRTKGIKNNSIPAVYVGGIGYKGQHGITSTEAGYPPFEMVKVENVVNELRKSGHLFIDREKLLMWNPDVIFFDTNGFHLIHDDYSKNPAFYNSLKAVKENKIFSVLPYNFYNTNIEVSLANAYFIGKVLHPGSFSDIVPEKKADEIFKCFVGLAVYHRMKKEFKGYGHVVFEEGKIDVR